MLNAIIIIIQLLLLIKCIINKDDDINYKVQNSINHIFEMFPKNYETYNFILTFEKMKINFTNIRLIEIIRENKEIKKIIKNEKEYYIINDVIISYLYNNEIILNKRDTPIKYINLYAEHKFENISFYIDNYILYLNDTSFNPIINKNIIQNMQINPLLYFNNFNKGSICIRR